jgi:hypothetical protein
MKLYCQESLAINLYYLFHRCPKTYDTSNLYSIWQTDFIIDTEAWAIRTQNRRLIATEICFTMQAADNDCFSHNGITWQNYKFCHHYTNNWKQHVEFISSDRISPRYAITGYQMLYFSNSSSQMKLLTVQPPSTVFPREEAYVITAWVATAAVNSQVHWLATLGSECCRTSDASRKCCRTVPHLAVGSAQLVSHSTDTKTTVKPWPKGPTF